MLVAIAVGSLTELKGIAQSPSDLNLALNYAPIHYQDTDSTKYQGDYITKFDYDSDWQVEPRQIENIPEQNTGDPRALRDFIVWGIENYPAENYGVILWNHGTGWKEDDIYSFARNRGVRVRASEDEVRSFTRSTQLQSAFFLSSIVKVLQLEDEESRAIAFDDSSLDFLDNAKLQQAFQEAEAITGKKVSLIGMDTCLMGMVEVAYQLRANANYMVASQEVEPLSGYPYTAILQNLTANPEITAETLAKLIVREYGRYYEGESRGSVAQITQSATNLKGVEKLVEALGRLATILRQLLVESDIYTENALYHAQRKAVRFRDREAQAVPSLSGLCRFV